MGTYIKLLIDTYNEAVENAKDPLVDSWFLMGSPLSTICILGAYLLFVLKLGPKIMQNRAPLKLKTFMTLYNAFQVVFTVWLASLGFLPEIRRVLFSFECRLPKTVTDDSTVYNVILSGTWWYFFAKVIELLDTVIFVLRKKNNQVSFLHVYHHTFTVLISWIYIKLLPGEPQGLVVGFLNSLVHIPMYSYYFLSGLGPEYQKYLWWKKYITRIQLTQFGIMTMYLMYNLSMDCSLPKSVSFFFLFNVILFMYLFSDFYRKSYTKKKNEKAKN